jgi:hypothetical protein
MKREDLEPFPRPEGPLYDISFVAQLFEVHPNSVLRALNRHPERYHEPIYVTRKPLRGTKRAITAVDLGVLREHFHVYVKRNPPASP